MWMKLASMEGGLDLGLGPDRLEGPPLPQDGSAAKLGIAEPGASGPWGGGPAGLRPNRGQRGPWKHPEPAAPGPRGPKQGGLRSAVVLCRSKGLEGPLWASHGGVPGQRRGQL